MTRGTQGNLLFLSDPLVIVGDIHGQYYDLLRMFEIISGLTGDKKYRN